MMSEEEIKVQKARDHWKIMSKKVRVLAVMSRIGEERYLELLKKKKNNLLIKKETEKVDDEWMSKMIISPNNYWNMQWNNFTQVIFVLYIFLTPMFVSESITMSSTKMSILMLFDIIFMIDRFLDLFAGFYDPNGDIETNVSKVISQNLSAKFFIEAIVSFGPLYFEQENLNTIIYTMFKIPRYTRLFEIDGQIQDILDFYSQTRTVFEVKQMEKSLNVLQFSLSTFINLHILTCIQIALCKHRDFEKSWMGSRGVKIDDFTQQYIYAVYFVTTTLSTCGFGDIFATPYDATESGVILFLQFVGMLFYSMTIQKVQSFMINDDIMPGDYANNMSETVENLIVKVSQLPSTRKIKSESINNWKGYTQSYFQTSPNAFLIENQYFNMLSENTKVEVVNKNLLVHFVEKFEILFKDPDQGFKADAKLVTMVIASLTLDQSYTDDSEPLLPLDIVSSRIYCIWQGTIDMYYKNGPHLLTELDEGSYFGEISYIYRVRNQYGFYRSFNKDTSKSARLFYLPDKYLKEIFNQYPTFKNLLKIRALRRHHYFKKLHGQVESLTGIKNRAMRRRQQDANYSLNSELMNIKKARLVEEKLAYEDLTIDENFSADEVTFTYNCTKLSEENVKKALVQCKQLDSHIKSLKMFAIESMDLVLNTLTSINENSQKIAFKHFDQDHVNLMSKETPSILERLKALQGTMRKEDRTHRIEEDNIVSDSSGNRSDKDEINFINRKRLTLNKGAFADSMLSDDDMDEDEELVEHFYKSSLDIRKDQKKERDNMSERFGKTANINQLTIPGSKSVNVNHENIDQFEINEPDSNQSSNEEVVEMAMPLTNRNNLNSERLTSRIGDEEEDLIPNNSVG